MKHITLWMKKATQQRKDIDTIYIAMIQTKLGLYLGVWWLLVPKKNHIAFWLENILMHNLNCKNNLRFQYICFVVTYLNSTKCMDIIIHNIHLWIHWTDISAWCQAMVTPLLTHWNYRSIAVSHQYTRFEIPTIHCEKKRHESPVHMIEFHGVLRTV